MIEPTTKEVLENWFDDGRVPWHRANAAYWRDSAGATIVMLCDRLDAEESRRESLFRQRNDALLRGDEALERLDAVEKRVAELEADAARWQYVRSELACVVSPRMDGTFQWRLRTPSRCRAASFTQLIDRERGSTSGSISPAELAREIAGSEP